MVKCRWWQLEFHCWHHLPWTTKRFTFRQSKYCTRPEVRPLDTQCEECCKCKAVRDISDIADMEYE